MTLSYNLAYQEIILVHLQGVRFLLANHTLHLRPCSERICADQCNDLTKQHGWLMGSRRWSGRHPRERVSQPLPVKPLSLLAPLFLFSYNSKKIALPLLTRFSTLAFPEKKTPFLRGEICPSRQSRRECKNFASGVNFFQKQRNLQ